MGLIEPCSLVVVTLDIKEPAVEPSECWSLMESLLGVYPGSVAQAPLVTRDPGGLPDSRVKVRGLVPGGPAMETPHIDLGDIIEEVNGKPVTLSNIESYLERINYPSSISLTVRKGTPQKPESSEKRRDSPSTKRKVILTPNQPPNSSGLVAARIVPLLSSNSSELIYPTNVSNSSFDEALKAISLTLVDLAWNSFKSKPQSLSLEVGSQKVEIAFQKLPTALFILIADHQLLPPGVLQELCGNACRLLRLLCPHAEPDVERDRALITNMLSSAFSCIYAGIAEPSVFTYLAIPKCLNLTVEIHNLVTDYLIEYEALDWRLQLGCLAGQRKPFLISGTCLYYKDYLVCRRINEGHFSALHLYLTTMQVVPLEGYTGVDLANQVVLWQRMHLGHQQSNTYDVFGGKIYVLVIRMKSFTLAIVMESGAAAMRFSSEESVSCPEMYHREAMNMLYNLRQTDLEAALDAMLIREADPSISAAESFLAAPVEPHVETVKRSTFRRIRQKFNKDERVAPKKRITTRHLSPSQKSQRKASPSPARKPAPTNPQDPNVSASTTPSLRRRRNSAPPSLKKNVSISSLPNSNISSSSIKNGDTASLGGTGDPYPAFGHSLATSSSMYSIDSRSMFYEEANVEHINMSAITLPTKVVSGLENSLLYYLDSRNGGVESFAPTQYQLQALGGALHAQIVVNFYKAIHKIRHQLRHTGCMEAGTLFTCQPHSNFDPKSTESVIKYWIIGRRFPEDDREIYICHHDFCSQNMRELAFKLLLAL